jgi:hypothetical protein
LIDRLLYDATNSVSASKDVMDRMMPMMNEGKYEMTYSSPHEPAGLLKLWLRSLTEAPIPPHLYPAVITFIIYFACLLALLRAYLIDLMIDVADGAIVYRSSER